MNTTSVMATTAGTMSTAGVAQILQWGLTGFPQPVPEGVCLTLAAVILSLGHLAYAYLGRRGIAPVDAPAATVSPAS